MHLRTPVFFFIIFGHMSCGQQLATASRVASKNEKASTSGTRTVLCLSSFRLRLLGGPSSFCARLLLLLAKVNLHRVFFVRTDGVRTTASCVLPAFAR